ncbi:glycosyl hydrolase [Novosphingobium sp. MW5]|nr:glycosyl hydrolase [Novosphingobium sp. MW5]
MSRKASGFTIRAWFASTRRVLAESSPSVCAQTFEKGAGEGQAHRCSPVTPPAAEEPVVMARTMTAGFLTFTAYAALLSATQAKADEPNALEMAFRNPPAEARPLVFWQWVNGNVSEDGIRADLAWMKRIKLSGALIFDIGFQTPPVPQLVERRVGFGTPEWQAAFKVAATEARKLGLSLGAQSGGGWSVSGGPGVTPTDAMKKLVWSETPVAAGRGPVRLAPLPVVAGPFQDLPVGNGDRTADAGGDIAVFAFPAPTGLCKADTSRSILDDRRFDRSLTLSPDANGLVTVTTGKGQPRSLTLAVSGNFESLHILTAAGEVATKIAPEPRRAGPVTSYALDVPFSPSWSLQFVGVKAPLELREARLSDEPVIDHFELKTGFGTSYAIPAHQSPAGLVPSQVLNLGAKLKADGSLNWRPSSGCWQVLRLGWSNTGRVAVPATPESRGLEVDKLDAGAVSRFAGAHYDRFAKAAGTSGALSIALTDSWEAGVQNWSPGLAAEFARRRGYDPLPWLPALAGHLVGKPGEADRFLADWRRTIADLIADNHYAAISASAHSRGLVYFAEAPGTDLPTIADGVQARRRVDVPTGEYWYRGVGAEPKAEHVADIREAASAAHLEGKPLVAAEALTSAGEEAWASGPREWRGTADRFFAEGVNRIILHTSVHQPFTDSRRPGITLRQYGQHFTRNETWAELAGGWTDYLARTSFLLQQGEPVADIAVFTGEEGAAGAALGFKRPVGFDYDLIDRETMQAMRVLKGALATPKGRTYRAVMLPASVRTLSIRTLEKLLAFRRAGGSVLGQAPDAPAGLADNPSRFARLVKAIWASPPATLRALGVQADLQLSQGHLDWTHRRTADTDIWFLANTSGQPWSGDVTLRDSVASQPQAELWQAEDGRTTALALKHNENGLQFGLRLEPYTSCFVVIRDNSGIQPPKVQPQNSDHIILDGPWQRRFLNGPAASLPADNGPLGSWTDSTNSTIRFHSGRAIYSKDFDIPTALGGQAMEIDLGTVGEMARVTFNGRDLGVIWWSPARLFVPAGLTVSGRNTIEVEVANYWKNALVGAQQPGTAAQTFSTINPYDAASPLRPSGLIGPVVLRAARDN